MKSPLPKTSKRSLYMMAQTDPALAHMHSLRKLEGAAEAIANAVFEEVRTALAEDKKALSSDLKAHVEALVARLPDIERSVTAHLTEKALAAVSARIAEITGIKGDDGHTPTKAELVALIKPLIPKPKEGKTPSDAKLLSLIKPLIPEATPGAPGSPDTPEQVAAKIRKAGLSIKDISGLSEALRNIASSYRKGGSKGGGGMGAVQHETVAVSSATTSISTSYKIAGNGYALWAHYQGQLIMRGAHYTVSADQKTIPLLFTPQDGTSIDLIYHRT